MNYIKHLTGFFNKSNQDNSISPTHISLYLALFQRWNLNRFKNPIIISREEMMTTAKIKSKATYHKCMKELHDRNYIIYKPSFNPYEGTEVILPDLSNSCSADDYNASLNFERSKPKYEPAKKLTSSNKEQSKPKNELPTAIEPSENKGSSNIEQNKSKKDEVKNQTGSESNTSSDFDLTTPKNELLTPKNDKNTSASSKFERSEPENELLKPSTRLKNERTELKNSQVDEQVNIYNNKTLENNNKTIYIPEEKKEESKSDFIAPTIELVKEFFQEKKVSVIEAEKYFNYYSSNGWKVGGKTQMKDWKAAARNWILNLDKFNPKKETGNLDPKNLNVSNSKDYAEPL
ncbi:hypothetical protein EOD40_00765 [Flavobacterium sufflavum]|uniref:Uncharacterized protein n=1 Tax=Flavobacterium sufflavum TaxID=1921138 RepID=A0A3S2XLY0_9FLAO|nr:hypothetical protein [Flavobacterium sufflavum]RVT79675.1 hypothetical protein EOD40_00765 [Flavobacterium sufflavum]